MVKENACLCHVTKHPERRVGKKSTSELERIRQMQMTTNFKDTFFEFDNYDKCIRAAINGNTLRFFIHKNLYI